MNRKQIERWKRVFINNIKQFHLRWGWKPRRANLDAINAFEAELYAFGNGDIKELISETGRGKDAMDYLRTEVFPHYFEQ